MNDLKNIICFLCLSTFVQPTLAAEDSDSVYGYDYIVKELTQTRSNQYTDATNPFDHILIHGGIALTSTQYNLKLPKGLKDSGFLQGFEANIGIDLLSRNWIAEGAVRSYSSERLGEASVSLQEFDLKVIYQNFLSHSFRLRSGFGLAARYLEYKNSIGLKEDYSTPSSIFLIGLAGQVGRNVSIGAEISFRNALVEDTIDDQALDASLRLGTHF